MNELKAPELRTSIVEHPLVQVARGEIPVVRPLTTYWVEIVRSRRERELYSFLGEVAQAIEDLRKSKPEQLDLTHIDSDDFAEILGNVAELAVREHEETKRSYLRRFVVNYSTRRRPDVTLRKIFFQFVSELSGLHLVLLDSVFEAQRSVGDDDLSVLAEQLDRPEAVSIRALQKALNVEEDLVAALAATLEANGLLAIVAPPTTFQDNTPRLIMRPLARRFMAFLQEKND